MEPLLISRGLAVAAVRVGWPACSTHHEHQKENGLASARTRVFSHKQSVETALIQTDSSSSLLSNHLGFTNRVRTLSVVSGARHRKG